MIRHVQEVFARAITVLRRRKLDQDFNEELATHVELLTELNSILQAMDSKLLPLPEEPASRVFLIARGAAGDEARLTSAFENAIRELDPKFKPNLLHTRSHVNPESLQESGSRESASKI